MREVSEEHELIFITLQGMTVRIPAGSVSTMGRRTQGVTLIATGDEDRVSGVATVVPDEDNGDGPDVPTEEGPDRPTEP